MDDNYPTLKRPKKKLVFPTAKAGLPDQWAQDIFTLEDVDKVFDDLVEDFPSPSTEIHIPNKKKLVERDVTPLPLPEELVKIQLVVNGDPHPHHIPGSPELDIDSETMFKAHGPVQTSSPIERNAIQLESKQSNHVDNCASPILFDCEDENQDLKTGETPKKKPQHNDNKGDESDDSLFETLPKKSTQKKKTVPTRSKPSSPPTSPVRRNELRTAQSAPQKPTKYVQASTTVKHDMTSFLQRLKNAGQSKPTCAGISQTKVMTSLPEPEPDDDFLILEDDVPLFVSIPYKYSKSTKEKSTKISSSDTETRGTAVEDHLADKQQNIEKDHGQQESQTLTEKNKRKTKNKGSESNSASSDKDHPLLATIESDNVENLLQEGHTKKKTQIKKVPSKGDNNSEDTDTERADGIPSKKIVKGEKAVKQSKPLKNVKEKGRRKTASAKENRGIRKANALTGGVEVQSQELNSENQLDNDAPVSVVCNAETEPAEDMADVNLGPSSQGEISDEDIVRGKRKRKKPGEWWLSRTESSEEEATEKQPTVKKIKQPNKETSSAASSVKAATGGGKKNLKPSSPNSCSQGEKAEKKKVKKGKLKNDKPVKTALPDKLDEGFGHPIQDRALDQDSDSDSSPLLFQHRERSISSGRKGFHKVYQNGPSEKKSSSPESTSTSRPEGVLSSRETTKRRRKCPGNWWQVNPTAEDQEVASSQPQQKSPKTPKTGGKGKKQAEKPTACFPPKPLEGAPKQKKSSLASTGDVCSSVDVNPPVSKRETLKKQNNVTTPPAEVAEANHNVVSIQMDELQGAQDLSPSQNIVQDSVQESTSKVIRSGPSSMIGLENYEEDEDTVLPSIKVQPVLCAADLCCAPLRPLILQPKDKVNLQDWLRSLWPPADSKNAEIMPDDFEWYCHRGKAMGILVDLNLGSICNGKMLLGSYMKKPLWVDHSATTVFNLLTSSVSVVVDCSKSHFSAGQSFMVPPGHAYSIQNLSAQPAVLYFTRFYTDESDN